MTRRWPRARCGRRSRPAATTGSTTSPPSSTSTAWARAGPTRHGWDIDAYKNRVEAFGWHAIEVDGHDVDAIDAAFAEAVATTGKPTVIMARTKKGEGVKAVEDQLNAHGKAVPDDTRSAIEELGGDRGITATVPKPPTDGKPHVFETAAS